jgi:hypothetical protein
MNQAQLNRELASENHSISSLENYMKNEPGESVIILEQFDLMFSRSELAQIKELWLKGVTLPEISERLNRDENELFLALFHLTFQTDGRKKERLWLPLSQIKGEEG